MKGIGWVLAAAVLVYLLLRPRVSSPGSAAKKGTLPGGAGESEAWAKVAGGVVEWFRDLTTNETADAVAPAQTGTVESGVYI